MTLRRADVIAGACGALAGAAPASAVAHVPAAVLIGAALGTARLRPRATWIFVALVTLIASASQAALAGDGGFAIYMLLGAHVFAVGRFESGVWSPVGVAALTAAGVAGSAFAPDLEAFLVLIVPATWAAGRTLRDRVLIADSATPTPHSRCATSARGSPPSCTTSSRRRSASWLCRRGPGSAWRRANRAGLGVRLQLEGDVEDVDADAAQLVRRVVQEGLTNALRYAADAPVTVSVRGEPDAVAVEVTNGPSSARAALLGTGNGLRGLREQVGSVAAEPTDDGGWRLAACVPGGWRCASPVRVIPTSRAIRAGRRSPARSSRADPVHHGAARVAARASWG